MAELEDALEGLQSKAEMFERVLSKSFAEIRGAFNPEVPIPEGCASCTALAEMSLRRVEEKLVEVSNAVKRVEKAIEKQGPVGMPYKDLTHTRPERPAVQPPAT